MTGKYNFGKRVFSAIMGAVCAVGTFAAMPIHVSAANAAKGIDGVSYLDSELLIALVCETFNGNVNLFLDAECTEPAILSGTSIVDAAQQYYFQGGGQVQWGYQCYAYAQGVFAHLFDELPLHGSEGNRVFQHCTSVLNASPEATFHQFLECRVMPGAYLRTTPSVSGLYNSCDGHSMIILGYNEDGVTVQEGNALGHGEISVQTFSWERFNNRFLEGKGRYIAHVVQPCDYYYQQQFDLSYDFSELPEQIHYYVGSVNVNRMGTGYTVDAPSLNRSYRWNSSDENIVRVDDQGNLTVLANGNAVVTAEDSSGVYFYNIAVDAVSWDELGDANGDGCVDSSDATAVLRCYVRTLTGSASTLNEQQTIACDVDNDMEITADDATLLLRFYVKYSIAQQGVSAESVWKQILA